MVLDRCEMAVGVGIGCVEIAFVVPIASNSRSPAGTGPVRPRVRSHGARVRRAGMCLEKEDARKSAEYGNRGNWHSQVLPDDGTIVRLKDNPQSCWPVF